MNTLTVAAFACVVVLASAAPSGLLGLGYAHHGHYDHLPLVGASGVVSSHGAAGPAGVVNGHGAVGPNGIPNAVHGHDDVIVGAHSFGHGHDDGQWHGEGLVASQEWAGHHGAAVVAPHGLGFGHGLGLGHGVGFGHGVAIGHGYGLGHGAVVAGASGTIVADGIYGHHGHAHHGW